MNFYSPMEQFNINTLFSVNAIINNINFYFIILLTIFTISNLLGSSVRIVPTYWNLFNESLYRTMSLLIINQINKKSIYFLPLIFTLFHFILFNNLIGMIPYSITPTVEIIITLTLSFTMLMGILLMGIFSHKQYIFAMFLPAGTPFLLIFLMIPLEILAYLTRTLSLGLRLAVNLITGHILAKVCINFIYMGYLNSSAAFMLVLSIPILLITLFLSLELLIAYLQAYIFTFITCLTIKDVMGG